MRDWVHSLIVLRKFNKEIKERQKKSTEELKSSKKELYKLIPEAKVCGYCNTELKDNDFINKVFKREYGSRTYVYNCRFCGNLV